MKNWFLLCYIFLVKTDAFSFPAVAEFENRGTVEINEGSHGLRLTTNLKLEPHQRYMVKLLSSCRRDAPYWVRFRYSFSFHTTADGNGVMSSTTHFLGTNYQDLKSRNLNTAAIFQLQKSHWKMISCVPIQVPDNDRSENIDFTQP